MLAMRCLNPECRRLFNFNADGHTRKYCSRSCAAKVNNRLFPKRKLGKNNFCICKRKKAKRAKICLKCIQEKKEKRTLRKVFQKGSSGVDKWVRVREDARGLMDKWGIKKECENCGWNKHVETIHVKPIASFDLDTLLNIVNKRSNLKYFCPNCHWLFDNKLLK